MKKWLLMGFISVALSGCATKPMESLSEKWAREDAKREEIALKGKVTDVTDKFTGKRTIKWEVGIVASSYYKNISIESFSRVIDTKKQYNQISITKKSKISIPCDTTYWLLDGKKFTLNPKDVAMIPGRDFYTQLMIFNPSDKQMKQLANARQIEMKICNNEYQFTENEMQGLQSIVQISGL